MPTYIALVDYTEQGAANITDSPDRLDDANERAEELGGDFREWYLTFGEHDAVAIAEFPDDETYAQFILAINRAGNVTTTTLKAFTEDEYRDVILVSPSNKPPANLHVLTRGELGLEEMVNSFETETPETVA